MSTPGGLRRPRCWPSVVGLSATLVTTAGCGDLLDLGAPEPAAPTPLQASWSVDIGSGVISPWRFIIDPDRPDRLLVLTGQGETFGASYLHALEIPSLSDRSSPLPVCGNASDGEVLGRTLVVACRGSDELVAVDLDAWVVADRLDLGFKPVSLSTDGRTSVFVTGVSDRLVRVDVGTRLRVARTRALDDSAHCVLVAGDRIFVSMPRVGIAAFGLNDFEPRGRWSVPSLPSFGCTAWGRWAWFTDRDGYVHRIALDGADLATFDVATWLGLDRSTVGLRGIEPIQFAALDDDHLLIVNNRAPSLVVQNGSFPEVIGTAPAGAGAVIATIGDLDAYAFINLPTSNALWLARLDEDRAGLSWSRHSIGTSIEDMTVLKRPSGSEVAVLDTRGVLHVIDESGRTTTMPSPRGRWFAPLGRSDRGDLLALSRTDSYAELARFGPTPESIEWTRLSLELPVSHVHDRSAGVSIVDRLGSRLEVVDSTGRSTVHSLSRSRPRVVAHTYLGWLVIHDTWPDHGVTLGSKNGEVVFRPLSGSLFDMAQSGRSIVVATFEGVLYRLDETGIVRGEGILPFGSVMRLGSTGEETMVAVAPDLGMAALFEVPSLRILEVFAYDDLQRMEGVATGYWLNTSRSVAFTPR